MILPPWLMHPPLVDENPLIVEPVCASIARTIAGGMEEIIFYFPVPRAMLIPA